MNDMSPADFQALAALDPQAALAIAQFALVQSTSLLVDAASTLVIIKIVVGLAQVVIVFLGIHMLNRADKRRHAEHNRRHAEAMARLRRDGKALDALIRRSGGHRGGLSTRHIGRRYP